MQNPDEEMADGKFLLGKKKKKKRKNLPPPTVREIRASKPMVYLFLFFLKILLQDWGMEGKKTNPKNIHTFFGGRFCPH